MAFIIESKKNNLFSGDGLKAHMDYYERLDVERIKQKWDLRRNLYQITRKAGEWGDLSDEQRSDDAHESSDDGWRRIDLFGTIEVWSDFVTGYLSSVADGRYLTEQGDFWKERARESVIGLRRNDIFHIPEIREWHAQNIERYPHIKAYIELVDHMRLMGINYIETYVFPRYSIGLHLE
jgi:hypothetical protein